MKYDEHIKSFQLQCSIDDDIEKIFENGLRYAKDHLETASFAAFCLGAYNVSFVVEISARKYTINALTKRKKLKFGVSDDARIKYKTISLGIPEGIIGFEIKIIK